MQHDDASALFPIQTEMDPADTNSGVSRRAVLRGTALASAAAVAATGLTFGAAPPAESAQLISAPPWLPAGLRNTYDPAREVYNYKPANTARHAAGLAAAAAGNASTTEVFLGDSSVDGYVGTGYDRAASWPMVYRSHLAKAGVPTGGSGWVRCADTQSFDPRWSYAPDWIVNLNVAYTGTVGATATYTEPMAGTAVAIMFSAAAFTKFTVSVDGATSGAGFRAFDNGFVETSTTILTLTGLPNTPHTVAITAGSRSFFILVAAMVYTPNGGLVVHNVAAGGARASGTGSPSWSDNSYWLGLGTLYGSPARYPEPPSTVWIALGLNDVHARAPSNEIIAAFRAIASRFPASDIFLVLEYQAPVVDSAAWTAHAGALYQLADELDVPLFDQWAKIGGYTTYKASGLDGDGFGHLNAAGYAVLGNWIGDVAGAVGTVTVPPPPVATGPVNVVPASGAAVTLPAPTAFALNYVVLSANCALTFPPPVAGQSITLVLAQGSAPHTVTWPATVSWPAHTGPVLTGTAGARDLFTFLCLDGATWFGTVAGEAY